MLLTIIVVDQCMRIVWPINCTFHFLICCCSPACMVLQAVEDSKIAVKNMRVKSHN